MRPSKGTDMPIPERFKPEQDAVEALIRRAFRGVTREGGVSWSEADAIDSSCNESEWSLARALDTEACWEDLIDDPQWDYDSTGGGFNFLDPIGWRYYIAPAMIRCTRDGGGEFISYHLKQGGEYRDEQVSLLSRNQKHAVATAIRLMIPISQSLDPNFRHASDAWSYVYRLHWRKWDRGGLCR